MAELVSMRMHAVGSTGDLGTGLSYAATGASVGSYLGPWGAVAGGVVGLAVGLFSGDEVVHGPLTLAKRAAVAHGLVPSGKAGTALFRGMLLNGDPRAVDLFTRNGGSLAKWLPAERARLAKKAGEASGGGMVSPPLTIQPVGPPVMLPGAQVTSSADVAPPGVAALIALLQQIVALGRV
jgi:hypothetical protein